MASNLLIDSTLADIDLFLDRCWDILVTGWNEIFVNSDFETGLQQSIQPLFHILPRIPSCTCVFI